MPQPRRICTIGVVIGDSARASENSAMAPDTKAHSLLRYDVALKIRDLWLATR